MPMYVQYDTSGNITATVNSMTPPICTNQIEVAPGTSLAGMMVNTTTQELEAAPPPTPTAASQAAAALAAGIVLTSTGTPSLNGTYALDQAAQNNVNGTVSYIMLNGTFPGGGTTMTWIDQDGDAHVWPSVTVFKAFATAFADYVAAVALYAASNGDHGSLPLNAITIA